jgi:hypothetical protein
MAWSVSIDQFNGIGALQAPVPNPVDFRGFTVSGLFDVPSFRGSIVITVLCECDVGDNYPFSRAYPGTPQRWTINCRNLSGSTADVTAFIYDDKGELQDSSHTFVVVNTAIPPNEGK